jgi:hypothetical protein
VLAGCKRKTRPCHCRGTPQQLLALQRDWCCWASSHFV